jgi:hypothetical protein
MAQALDVRVKRAALLHRRNDFGQHLLACRSGARTVVIQHAQASFGGIAFGGQRCGSLSDVCRVRACRYDGGFNSENLFAHARQLRFKLLARMIRSFGFRLRPVVIMLAFARMQRFRPQLRNRRTRCLELAVHAIRLARQRGDFGPHSGNLRLDMREVLSCCIALPDCAFGVKVPLAQRFLCVFEMCA